MFKWKVLHSISKVVNINYQIRPVLYFMVSSIPNPWLVCSTALNKSTPRIPTNAIIMFISISIRQVPNKKNSLTSSFLIMLKSWERIKCLPQITWNSRDRKSWDQSAQSAESVMLRQYNLPNFCPWRLIDFLFFQNAFYGRSECISGDRSCFRIYLVRL